MVVAGLVPSSGVGVVVDVEQRSLRPADVHPLDPEVPGFADALVRRCGDTAYFVPR
jgi:hypothetical protein